MERVSPRDLPLFKKDRHQGTGANQTCLKSVPMILQGSAQIPAVVAYNWPWLQASDDAAFDSLS